MTATNKPRRACVMLESIFYADLSEIYYEAFIALTNHGVLHVIWFYFHH